MPTATDPARSTSAEGTGVEWLEALDLGPAFRSNQPITAERELFLGTWVSGMVKIR